MKKNNNLEEHVLQIASSFINEISAESESNGVYNCKTTTNNITI